MQDQTREQNIREYCQKGEFDVATQITIKEFGPEILGWLRGISKDDALTEDAFQEFCLDLWGGISQFRWQSLLRTWAYRVAWRAFCQIQRGEKRRREQGFPQSQISQLALQVTSIHSRIYRKQIKSRLAQLRQQLPEETQTLLILRVDRGFSFAQIAQILSLSEDATRTRYQRAKQTLKNMAQKEGLLDGSS